MAKVRKKSRKAEAPGGGQSGGRVAPGGEPRIPVWLPPVLFVVATVALFNAFIFSDQMLYGEDSLSLGYMARAFFAERLSSGDFPLWSPRLLGGIPFIEALAAGDSIYPTSLLYLVMEPYRALGWKLVLHVMAGGFFMYGWVRAIGLGRASATVGGLAWLMAPVIVTLVLPGNDGKLMVATLAPLVFWATERVFVRPGPGSAAGLAGAVGLTCLTTQFQTSYFLFWAAGAYALFRTVQLWRGRGGDAVVSALRGRWLVPLGMFTVGALLGVGLAAVQLLPAFDYVQEASRRIATTVDASPEAALAYSSSWSLHPEEVVALAIPEFVGNSRTEAAWGQGTYWGRNPLKFNHEYLGITVLVLAAASLFGRRKRGLRWYMVGLSGVSLLFALGAHTPVWRVFYEVVPGISLFRVPSLAAFLVSFGATSLLALAVDDLVGDEERVPLSMLKSGEGRLLLGVVGVLFLGALLQSSGTLTRMWTTTVYPGISQRGLSALAVATPYMTRGFALALLLASATVGVVWASRNHKLGGTLTTVGLALLVAIDLGRVDVAFIGTFDFDAWAAPDENVLFLQTQLDGDAPFRVADLRGNDQNVDLAMFGLDLVAGHHPNDLARYRQLLGLSGSQPRGTNTTHPNVLRILSTKFLLWPEEAAGGPPFEGARLRSRAQTIRGTEAVYDYPGLGRAWLVGTSRTLDDESALQRILGGEFDPEREVILADEAESPGRLAVEGAVVWERVDPDYRRLRVRTDGPALLVVSENWFPGWIAELNGNQVPVRRANLTLQAVQIPAAGDHELSLRYTAPTVARAGWISLSSALAVLLMALAPILLGRLRKAPRVDGTESG